MKRGARLRGVIAWGLFCGACTQTAVLGDGNAGGDDTGPIAAGGSGGQPPVGSGGSGGGSSSDPAALAAEVCAAREACEGVDPSCLHEMLCIFTVFRDELHAGLTPCLSSCGAFDDCWQVAVAGHTPPDEFALYVSECNQSGVDCENAPEAMSHDWCEYDFMAAESYAAMVDCFDVSCGDINNCLRGVAFAAEPSCFDF